MQLDLWECAKHIPKGSSQDGKGKQGQHPPQRSDPYRVSRSAYPFGSNVHVLCAPLGGYAKYSFPQRGKAKQLPVGLQGYLRMPRRGMSHWRPLPYGHLWTPNAQRVPSLAGHPLGMRGTSLLYNSIVFQHCRTLPMSVILSITPRVFWRTIMTSFKYELQPVRPPPLFGGALGTALLYCGQP